MEQNISKVHRKINLLPNRWAGQPMLKFVFFFLIAIRFSVTAWAQSGCTDPNSPDYDPNAKTNNGSCTYSTTTYTLTNPKALPTTLNETSGLIFTGGQLWTLNDGGSSASIYRISETDGSILQTVTIGGATNSDWEAITADAGYFYLGDFGNNTHGNRTDLKIYRVSKSAIAGGSNLTVPAEVINFAYSDQVIQNPVTTGANSTKFDCEAFLVKDNLLHLFTKDWVTNGTVHYTLPTTPGNYIAQRKESFMVNGLITDAHISTTNPSEIILIGYSGNLASLFMWVLWDYPDNSFFSGNKRRIDLGSAFQGQIEGVTFTSNGTGYISSERINEVNVPAKLFSFSTATWVPLPIDLIYFRATYTSPVVKLTWQTATEINNISFTVERAAADLNFKPLGQQQGAGNSQVVLNYTFTDASPADGLNYYRLKQTDRDGTFTYSGIKAITANTPLPSWQISPIPVSAGQQLTVKFNILPAPGTTLTLIGSDGKVYAEKLSPGGTNLEAQLSMPHVAPGVYILKCRSSQAVQVAKVIIN